jgi:hypothetical protein
MNLKQSWSRHGEEVKASTLTLFEMGFLLLGVISPALIIIFTM